ncbi:MAG: S1C family serine protease [Actinomycetia bacterium]|nr:S1C family serine protease [Actinomycetes bacterium]
MKLKAFLAGLCAVATTAAVFSLVSPGAETIQHVGHPAVSAAPFGGAAHGGASGGQGASPATPGNGAASGQGASPATSGNGGPSGRHGPSVTWPGGSGPGSSTATAAAQSVVPGVVLVDAVIDYGTAESAGTGLVVSPDGVVVTNHHVVANSTSVTVTVPQTGVTYSADVLGYSTTEDVAVLRLIGASALTTVVTSTAAAAIGDPVTVVGNAGGQGRLVTTNGHVTDLDQSITATDDNGAHPEQLANLIQVDASMVPGDSGGATVDASDSVIGMNVAGSANAHQSQSYAIPIATVLDVERQVMTGHGSATVTVGRTAALGVSVSADTSKGVLISGIVPGGAADKAGLTVGSTITALGGKTIAANDDLKSVLSRHQPGDDVSVTWSDRSGTSHTATVTLGAGPLA